MHKHPCFIYFENKLLSDLVQLNGNLIRINKIDHSQKVRCIQKGPNWKFSNVHFELRGLWKSTTIRFDYTSQFHIHMMYVAIWRLSLRNIRFIPNFVIAFNCLFSGHFTQSNVINLLCLKRSINMTGLYVGGMQHNHSRFLTLLKHFLFALQTLLYRQYTQQHTYTHASLHICFTFAKRSKQVK